MCDQILNRNIYEYKYARHAEHGIYRNEQAVLHAAAQPVGCINDIQQCPYDGYDKRCPSDHAISPQFIYRYDIGDARYPAEYRIYPHTQ